VLRVEEEVSGHVQEARQHNVAELARAALDEGERVAVELAHVAHHAPALRALGNCDGDHDRYSSRLRFRFRIADCGLMRLIHRFIGSLIQ